jgi:hypothetical protein
MMGLNQKQWAAVRSYLLHSSQWQWIDGKRRVDFVKIKFQFIDLIPKCQSHLAFFQVLNGSKILRFWWFFIFLFLIKRVGVSVTFQDLSCDMMSKKIKIILNYFWKFFNSHLFWLNSHPFFAWWSRNAADLQALGTRQARPGCEFNQKRCELKNFLAFC